MSARSRWLRTTTLLRAACVIGLVSLLTMSLGLLVPSALLVVISMSLGQGLGVLAFACYLAAILREIAAHEAAKRASRPSS